jgi:FecR protein
MFIRCLLLPLFLLGASLPLASAAPTFDSANLTFIQHDVAVAELDVLVLDEAGKLARRPATLNESIAQNQAILTGRKSRAELKFNDGTITRIGQLTSFTYGKGTRDLEVKQGSALFVVPKGMGGTKIQAGSVTAAITGTTLLVQVFADRVLIFVYEGSVEAGGFTIRSGQVLTIPTSGAPGLVSFDIRKGIETAALFTKFIESDSQAEILRLLGDVVTQADPGGNTTDVGQGEKTVVNPRVNQPIKIPTRPNDNDDYYNGNDGDYINEKSNTKR